ncbi:substrate-binding domain-containing protein [Verrucomicrobiota bacterium]
MRQCHLLFIPAICVLIFILIGCGDKTPKKESAFIAVIPKGTTHEFWKSVHAGAIDAARELNVNIIWKGPLKEDDREQQIAMVENFISSGAAGIALAPLDDTALRAPVTAASKQGIPVVIFDSNLKSDDYVSFVATDNYRGGVMAAEKMVQLLSGKGRVIVLRYQEGSDSTFRREQGFLDTIKKHPQIQVASANQYGGSTTETAYRASENLLAPYKDAQGNLTIDGIFCPNESTTFGMLRALQDSGLAGKVRFIGFDTSAKLESALRQRQINGLILQNPRRMGYLAVKTLIDHIRGIKVPARIDTGATLVSSENADKPEIKALLSPDFQP